MQLLISAFKAMQSAREARFSQCVQKDFKHGFRQPYRFCHMEWVKPSGKMYKAARGNLFEDGIGVGWHLENRSIFVSF
jgi:hypothetical protein